MSVLIILLSSALAFNVAEAKTQKANETDSGKDAQLVSFEQRNMFEDWMVRKFNEYFSSSF